MVRGKSWVITAYTAQTSMAAPLELGAWIAHAGTDGFFETARLTFIAGQRETAPTTGREHLQVFATFRSQVTVRTVQRRLGLPGAHVLKKVAASTFQQAADYCRKDDTYVAGTARLWRGELPQQGKRSDLQALYEFIAAGHSELECMQKHFGAMARGGRSAFQRLRILEAGHLAETRYVPVPIVLLPWQHDMLVSLAEPPKPRQIFWIWSRTSKTGKSTFGTHLSDTQDSIGGLWNLTNFLYVYQSSLARIILFNLPRTQDLDEKKLATLEALSDQGRLTFGKYEGGKVMVAAHVVVFANIRPPVASLPDRITEVHVPESALAGPVFGPFVRPLAFASPDVAPLRRAGAFIELDPLHCDEVLSESETLEWEGERSVSPFIGISSGEEMGHDSESF